MEINKIYNMDCLEGMRQLDSDSVDLIATDPPYGYSFMGKEWDVLPTTEILKECLRVLKPGAFAFWLMTPRQDSQLDFLARLREAGFIIRFTPIYWTYMSGFPKAANIANLISKREGAEREGAEREGAEREGAEREGAEEAV